MTLENQSEAEQIADDPRYLTLSLKKIDHINSMRGQYILLYLVWFVIQGYFLFTVGPDAPPNQILAVIATVMLVVFCVQFIRVLRSVGYPWPMWVATVFFAILPIPGLILVAYIDRGIGKSLRKGLDDAEAALERKSP